MKIKVFFSIKNKVQFLFQMVRNKVGFLKNWKVLGFQIWKPLSTPSPLKITILLSWKDAITSIFVCHLLYVNVTSPIPLQRFQSTWKRSPNYRGFKFLIADIAIAWQRPSSFKKNFSEKGAILGQKKKKYIKWLLVEEFVYSCFFHTLPWSCQVSWSGVVPLTKNTTLGIITMTMTMTTQYLIQVRLWPLI